MPSVCRWIGDALPVAQVVWITVADAEAGDIFEFTINRKKIRIVAEAALTSIFGQTEPLSDPAHSVYTQLAAALEDTTIAEFKELSAIELSTVDQDGNPSSVLPFQNYAALKLTGLETGRPIEITAATVDAGGMVIDVQVVSEGSAGRNEKQTYSFAVIPTGGTYTLQFQNVTSGSINHNASAATIQTALEAMSNIAPGDVIVTGSYTTGITVEFAATYANTAVQDLIGDGTSLTGAGSVRVTTSTQGAPGQNYKQRMQGVGQTWTGSIYLNLPGQAPVFFYVYGVLTAEQMKANHFDPRLGYNDVAITKGLDGDNAYFDIEWTGTYATTEDAYITAGSGVTITDLQGANGTVVEEVQIVRLLGNPQGGTYTLTFQGQTTAGIAYNAAASAVQSALEGLSNLAPGDITVALVSTGVYSVTFEDTGAYAGVNVNEMTGTSSLTGGQIIVAETQAAQAPTNEVQLVGYNGIATGGTFTLDYDGQETGNIDFDATAAEIVTALEALSNIGSGDVAVSGVDGGPWTIQFQGALAATNVEKLIGDGANITSAAGSQTVDIETTVEATSPNHWDEPNNWDTGVVPITDDTVIIENSTVPIWWGLDQSAVTLAVLRVKSTFAVQLGLPDVNEDGSYFEYRERYLKIGATLCVIGEGDGGGAKLVRINFGTVQTNCIVQKTGNSDNADPVCLLRGTHASNVLNLQRGSVGTAMYASELATFATINAGFISSQDDDVQLKIGGGTTWAILNMSGGVIEAALGGTGTVTQTGGDLTINGTNGHSGALILQKDAVCHWNNAGALGSTPVVAGDAWLDFDQDMRAKAVTNPIERQSKTAKITDNFKVVASLIIDCNYCEVDNEFLQLGSNIRITRGTPS